MAGPVIYDLTPLLRGAAAERRITVNTLDLNRRTVLVTLAALPVAVAAYYVVRLTVTALAALFGSRYSGGMYLLLVVPVVEAIAIALFRGRSRRGLRLTYWSTWTDRRKSKGRLGQVYVRGIPVDDSGDTIVSIARPGDWCQDDPRPDIPVVRRPVSGTLDPWLLPGRPITTSADPQDGIPVVRHPVSGTLDPGLLPGRPITTRDDPQDG